MKKIILLLIIIPSLWISISCSFYMGNYIRENIHDTNYTNLPLMILGSLVEIFLWLVTFNYVIELRNLYKK